MDWTCVLTCGAKGNAFKELGHYPTLTYQMIQFERKLSVGKLKHIVLYYLSLVGVRHTWLTC